MGDLGFILPGILAGPLYKFGGETAMVCGAVMWLAPWLIILLNVFVGGVSRFVIGFVGFFVNLVPQIRRNAQSDTEDQAADEDQSVEALQTKVPSFAEELRLAVIQIAAIAALCVAYLVLLPVWSIVPFFGSLEDPNKNAVWLGVFLFGLAMLAPRWIRNKMQARGISSAVDVPAKRSYFVMVCGVCFAISALLLTANLVFFSWEYVVGFLRSTFKLLVTDPWAFVFRIICVFLVLAAIPLVLNLLKKIPDALRKLKQMKKSENDPTQTEQG